MILIDTQALVWLDDGNAALGKRARQAADEAFTIGALWVSAISFCEIALLVERERLGVSFEPSAWRRNLIERGLRERMVDGLLAIQAVQLPNLHRDPADRIILATAMVLEATLLTADAKLLAWPGSLPRLDAAC